MVYFAAPGDTWDVSGPDFLLGYALALAILVLFALYLRRAAVRGVDDPAGRLPTPAETALLTEGPTLAVFASLAALRTAKAVEVNQARVLSSIGVVPDGLSDLDRAVWSAAGRGVPLADLAMDHRVRPALDAVRESAARAGWLLDGQQRSRARRGMWLIFALTAFGLLRIYAGVQNDRPVGFLTLLVVLTAAAGVYFAVVPRLTAAGKRAMAEQRGRYRHLAPAQSPAWSTYGFTGAAMGVALYGTGALWAADHEFATGLGITRPVTTDSATSSAASSGAGCGSGGDGGGGGCGGGGCGG